MPQAEDAKQRGSRGPQRGLSPSRVSISLGNVQATEVTLSMCDIGIQ